MDALRAWLELTGHTHAWLADEIGVTRQAVTAWLADVSEPSADNYRALHRITQIPLDKLLARAAA